MAGSLNKVMLIGRLGADPELRYMPSGQPVANFNLATDDSYKDKNTGQKVDRTDWHKVAVFGKSAEFCSNYLSKGRLVYVEGKLQTRKWQDRDGNDRYTTEVVVNPFGGTVQGLDSQRDAQGGGGYQGGGGGGYQQGGGQQGGGYQQRGPQQGGQQGGQQGAQQNRNQAQQDEDMGPAFPSEASGMDDVPF